MRQLSLKEYEPSAPVVLSIEDRDALKALLPSLSISPASGTENAYILKPDSIIGAVNLPGLAIQISPKIPIDRVMFLISYALDPSQWSQLGFSFDEQDSLVEATVPGFVAQLQRALKRGILQGYHRQEEALMTVRGRIRFEEQLRRRNGIALPIEVAYDEFTEDILENQLLKAAVQKLLHMPLKSGFCRQSLRHFEYVFQQVSSIHYSASNIPEIPVTRLNQHYSAAIALARLILRSTSVELKHGKFEATSFLVDMNEVFETFVTVALRDRLQLSEQQFRQNAKGYNLDLDADRIVHLAPDLLWTENGKCVFVGDVKYKKINIAGVKHPDLYQLLAYTVATHVSCGLLIYAAGQAEPAKHVVPAAGKRLDVVVLDVSGKPQAILDEVKQISDRILEQKKYNLQNQFQKYGLTPT